ncbi:MAG TPA: DUF4474 domain-containing protein [Bacillota bacterium]|nr:DUF4474 domain-containing protein [Bacillota bacterium]
MLELIQTLLTELKPVFPAILVLGGIFAFLIYRIVRDLFPRHREAGEKEFEELLSDAGYEYEASQGILVAKMNPWQKKCGYCRLYDEACAPIGMIVDSEPVSFEYEGKRWLIEFWKGQYYLNTGCEIGVYNTKKADIAIPDFFTGTFYHSARKADMLEMAFTLYRNGKELFSREEKHWWLTGFKPGEFSEPSELSMRVRITFKGQEMCGSFLKAMKKLGYKEDELITNGVTAEFTFDKPHGEQPLSRTEEAEWFAQRYNEHCCNLYREVTAGCDTFSEKLKAVLEKEPFLYHAVIQAGKAREIFDVFKKIKKYIKRF